MTDCVIFPLFDPSSAGPHPAGTPCRALWDTGATGTVISERLAMQMRLVPTGMIRAHGVQGAHVTETFLVNIQLPNKVGFAGVTVTKGILGNHFDVLVGMDIISRGDFAITQQEVRKPGGAPATQPLAPGHLPPIPNQVETVFSFRLPSSAQIDFVADNQRARAQAAMKSLIKQRPGKKKHRK